jgi:hypothetical protein
VARKPAALPPTPEAPLLAAAHDIASKIEATNYRLRVALLAGDGTAAIRAELATLQDRAADVGAELVAVSAELLEQAAAGIEARAREMVAGMELRLAALIAALQPPPPPASA